MQPNKTKIIFFGTSDFAVPALDGLVKEGYDIVTVITTPDKPVGRKQILTPPPVKTAAQKLGLDFLQPEKLRNNFKLFEEFKKVNADIGIVAAYGKLIPPEIFNLPKHSTINIHPSLLPKYRGPTPIQTTLINGDTETGVTILKVDEEMDHGEIISSADCQILNLDNYKSLHDKLARLGTKLLIKTLPDYLSGKIKSAPQNHSKAIFTKKFTSEDGEIKPGESAELAYNKIRALNPEPGTFIWFEKNSKKTRLKILEAELIGRQLNFKKVQPEGGKPMNMKEFMAGHPHFKINLI